jgi:toxin ParE1/3/4
MRAAVTEAEAEQFIRGPLANSLTVSLRRATAWGNFRYIIRYQVVGDVVVIQLVRHSARQPAHAQASLSEIVWTDPALANLEAIRTYIEQFNPRAARQLANSLIEAGNSLTQFPYRGRPVRGTDMRELVTSHPYIIRYQVVGEIAGSRPSLLDR